ncbi:histidine protein methyltransferase 1 homolog [Lutzomyia longipalpis]|uniref:histidine protein methyltransferase 1 homolog n=1 Tax=Lutzomyia longipalpis TaxID=7200 RepID=UPI0024838B9B|nr:histidine protein methyltransferase 1 homolog [Lutzomyia longipalpis]
MFKFNFNIKEDPEGVSKEEKVKEKEAAEESRASVLGFEKIIPFKHPSLGHKDYDNSFSIFTSHDMEIRILDRGVEEEELDKQEETHSDLIPGTYEGGFKIWECTQDLADFLQDNLKDELEGKNVLDLGCGAGILGMIALKLGAAKCHFHDYNKDVLENFTIPNIHLNTEGEEKISIDKCEFISGDWEAYTEATDDTFDVILTSETIYNPANNRKLINLFMKKLKKGGKILLAAKTYYFGVGGGLRQFEELLDGKLKSEVVWKNKDGVMREIIKIEH